MDTQLKTWRVSAEKTSEQAANDLGVTVGMWSRWETGARLVPVHRLLDVEKLTGIPRHELRPDLAAIFVPSPDRVAS